LIAIGRLQVSTVLLRDAVGNRKTEARTLPHLFGREKRLE
jgi:hypothetical protein